MIEACRVSPEKQHSACTFWQYRGKRMKTTAVVAAILLTRIAGAWAESCVIPTKDEVEAQTAKCLISIDGRLLVNERCNIQVAPNGRETILDAGKYYVDVNVTSSASRHPGVATASWNRGSGRSDSLTSLGPVTAFQRNDSLCFRNRRIEMCYSDFLTCKCGPQEFYGCKRSDGD